MPWQVEELTEKNESLIRTKRVYESPSPEDGIRILVDRLWPRGLKKETLRLDDWLKEIAPSDLLRRWFNHDPSRWEDFKQEYWKELNGKPELCRRIINQTGSGAVTLLHAAKDSEHNNAVALAIYLRNQTMR